MIEAGGPKYLFTLKKMKVERTLRSALEKKQSRQSVESKTLIHPEKY